MSQNQEPLNTVFNAETAGKNIDSFVNKHKKAIGATVLAITIFVGGMIFQNNRSETTVDQPETELPAGEEEIKVPREAKDFVEQYSARYGGVENTISVYYSEKAYEKKNKNPNIKSLIISDEYVKNFIPTEFRGGEFKKVSDHGFKQYELPKDTELNLDSAVKITNEFFAPSLSLYMNLLAKNPSPEAQAIIDDEFTNYCSNSISEFFDGSRLNSAYMEDNADIERLMNFAKSVVAKYGSNVTYTVMPLSTDSSKKEDTNTSYIASYSVPSKWSNSDMKSADNNVLGVTANRMAINLDEYNNSVATSQQLISYNFSIDFTFQPTNENTSPNPKISIGLYSDPVLYP